MVGFAGCRFLLQSSAVFAQPFATIIIINPFGLLKKCTKRLTQVIIILFVYFAIDAAALKRAKLMRQMVYGGWIKIVAAGACRAFR